MSEERNAEARMRTLCADIGVELRKEFAIGDLRVEWSGSGDSGSICAAHVVGSLDEEGERRVLRHLDMGDRLEDLGSSLLYEMLDAQNVRGLETEFGGGAVVTVRPDGRTAMLDTWHYAETEDVLMSWSQECGPPHSSCPASALPLEPLEEGEERHADLREVAARNLNNVVAALRGAGAEQGVETTRYFNRNEDWVDVTVPEDLQDVEVDVERLERRGAGRWRRSSETLPLDKALPALASQFQELAPRSTDGLEEEHGGHMALRVAASGAAEVSVVEHGVKAVPYWSDGGRREYAFDAKPTARSAPSP